MVTDYLDAITGGAEKQMYLLAKGLVQRGWKVDLLVLQSDCKDRASFEREGIEVFVEKVSRVYSPRGREIACRWRKRIAQRAYCGIFSYHFGADLWLAMFLRDAYPGAMVSMRRDAGFWMRPYHPWVYRWFINPRFDYVCAVSHHVKDVLRRQQGVPEAKIRVIPNGVESFLVEEKGEKEDGFVITYVANLSEVKNHRLLVESASLIRTRIPEMRIWLVGKDKGTMSSLKRLVHAKGLESVVEFLGERRDIPEILSRSDICVQLSRDEGMSNTLLEYMSAGKPCIATAIAPNKEVLGNCGLYVSPDDPMDLAGAILSLYENEEVRRTMGQMARERIRREYSVERMISRYEKLLEEITCGM